MRLGNGSPLSQFRNLLVQFCNLISAIHIFFQLASRVRLRHGIAQDLATFDARSNAARVMARNKNYNEFNLKRGKS